MIFHEVNQQSPEWFKMRLGLATASCFHKIITPKTGKISKSAESYAFDLIGELVTGENAEKFTSYWMERGQQYEAEARSMYQVISDHDLACAGFVTNDEMTIGASPDALVLKGGKVIGGAEIKCPAPGTHIENLKRMKESGTIDPHYIPQVQGQILIGGFEFVDWFSYHPEFPPAHVRTYRDDAFCDALSDALSCFVDLMDETISMLEKMGKPVPPRPILSMKTVREKAEDVPEYLMAG
ncbi:MAG: hypothetical protein E6R04_06470 [Spirochaetes bacterium]|nr:MAG: hypothetical protein E6R04_06470 [Spirochaetota bacterium]